MSYTTEKNTNGFTLIELLIAMALALVVIASLSSVFITQHKTFNTQEEVAAMVQRARAAMDMMSREIKMAGYDPADSGITGVPYSASQLEIRADLNGDGDTSDANEDIIYTFDSANKQIERNTGAGAQPFSENIQSFAFSYWKADGITEVTSTADQDDIRQIEITITAQTSKPDPDYGQNSGYRTHTLTSRITPPNLNL